MAVARVTTHSLHSSGCRSDVVLSCHAPGGSDVTGSWRQRDASSSSSTSRCSLSVASGGGGVSFFVSCEVVSDYTQVRMHAGSDGLR